MDAGANAVSIVHDARRHRSQSVAFAAAGVLMLGVVALGVALLVSAFAVHDAAGVALGIAFGLLFLLVGAATVLTAVELLVRLWRTRPPAVVLRADDAGLRGVGRVGVPWDAIAAVHVRHLAPARRARAVGGEHALRLAVAAALDRVVGTGLGIRDGRRTVIARRLDGTTIAWDLTLAVAPADLAAVTERIRSVAASHRVPCEG